MLNPGANKTYIQLLAGESHSDVHTGPKKLWWRGDAVKQMVTLEDAQGKLDSD